MNDDLYSLKPRQIVMYAVDWCPDCRRAKFFFQRKSIEYVMVNVDEDQQGSEFVKELNRGRRSVPTIVFPDGSIMVEPSSEQLSEKFSVS